MILPAKIKRLGTRICAVPFSFFSSVCLLNLLPKERTSIQIFQSIINLFFVWYHPMSVWHFHQGNISEFHAEHFDRGLFL